MFYGVIDHTARRMSSNHPLELNRAVLGGRVEMFAIRDDGYPGGWFYRFQYYRPDEGPILRYDNAHDDAELGKHHRHVRDGHDTEIEFDGLVLHVAQFLREVGELAETDITDTPTDNEDTNT
jgi:hypothetical protein